MGRKQKIKRAAAAAAKSAVAEIVKTVESKDKAISTTDNCTTTKQPVQLDGEKFKVKDKTNGIAKKDDEHLQNLKKLLHLTTMTSKTHRGGSNNNDNDSDDFSSDSDDLPELKRASGNKEPQTTTDAANSYSPTDLMAIGKHSRGEKKARRLLMKMDLKQIPDISRVTMRKAKTVLLIIEQPEVYKCHHTETYIIFGNLRVEDLTSVAASQAADRYIAPEGVVAAANNHLIANGAEEQQPYFDDFNDDYDVDKANELDEKDIELVQMQACCSRSKAIKSLLAADNDVVNAIMSLTIA